MTDTQPLETVSNKHPIDRQIFTFTHKLKTAYSNSNLICKEIDGTDVRIALRNKDLERYQTLLRVRRAVNPQLIIVDKVKDVSIRLSFKRRAGEPRFDLDVMKGPDVDKEDGGDVGRWIRNVSQGEHQAKIVFNVKTIEHEITNSGECDNLFDYLRDTLLVVEEAMGAWLDYLEAWLGAKHWCVE